MRLLLSFFALILFFAQSTFGQNDVLNLFPIISKQDFSEAAQKRLDRRDELFDKEEELTESERRELDKLLNEFSEVDESIWDVVHMGCSWYCAGGPYKLEASSNLKSHKKLTYDADNAHDLNYKSAWIEGIEGYGIGEYLLYFFKKESPRIQTISVSNGYVKSEKAWKNNSRVKN